MISVKLESFEGPLDLLLHLIDKNKVTITDIPIALITDQYMEIMDAMDHDKMEIMSEFIDMAATLIQIKTRMLLPKQKDENGEEIDPRYTLMQQLLEYKKYKMMAEKLGQRQSEADMSFFKAASIPDEIKDFVPKADPDELLKDFDFSILYKTFNQMMRQKKDKIDPIRSTFGTIKREVFSMHDKIDEILTLHKVGNRIRFKELLAKTESKSEMIATFLAVLELMKISKIKVVQQYVFEEIDIEFV